MEKVVRVSFNNDQNEQNKWNYHFDSGCTTKTVGDVKCAFAMMNGFYEDRILLTFNGDILDDSKLLSDIKEGWENCSYPSSSDSDGERDALGADGDEDQDNREADQREKGAYDESEKDQSKRLMDLFNDFYGKLSLQPNYDKGKKLNKSNKLELQDQIVTIMRMQREEREPFQSIGRPGPVLILDVEVEEAFTIAIITANDDVKYLTCRGQDTLETTRHRIANLFHCSYENLELRRREDSNLFNDGELSQTLNEANITDGGSLFASRKGRHKIRTLFGLCACMDIEVNMEKNARSLRRKIVTVAPDLTYINFFMWYNGKFLSIERNDPPLGDVIMGSSLLRVIIEMDLEIPHSEDTGPELRRRSDEAEARRRHQDRPPRLSSSSEKSDNSQERSRKPQEHLWFEVNKRALRNFDLVVECYKDEDDANTFDNGAEHEPAISLTKLTHRMRFYDLRQKIAAVCNEKSSHQIIYRNGEPFKSEDDHKTLRELELTPDENGIVRTIYKEPSITVWIEYKNEKIDMKVAGKATSFGRLAQLLVYEKKVKLRLDEIAFEHDDFIVPKDVLFSEVHVKNNDTIKLLETFKVRVWQRLFIYDKQFWPHSLISDFKKWVEKESDIKVQEQVFVKIDDDSLIKLSDPEYKKITMQDYGVKEMGEIEVFKADELPEWLKERVGGNEFAGNTARDEEDECRDSSDEDDADYAP